MLLTDFLFLSLPLPPALPLSLFLDYWTGVSGKPVSPSTSITYAVHGKLSELSGDRLHVPENCAIGLCTLSLNLMKLKLIFSGSERGKAEHFPFKPDSCINLMLNSELIRALECNITCHTIKKVFFAFRICIVKGMALMGKHMSWCLRGSGFKNSMERLLYFQLHPF